MSNDIAANDTARYRLTAEETVARLQTARCDGLGSAHVEECLHRYGPNEIREGNRHGPLRILAVQFTDFMIQVPFAAANALFLSLYCG